MNVSMTIHTWICFLQYFWSIQNPVMHRLVFKCNTPKVFSTIDIPGTNKYPEIVSFRVFFIPTDNMMYDCGGHCNRNTGAVFCEKGV